MFFNFFLIAVTPVSAHALDYYVSQQGNDQWTGTIRLPNIEGNDGPFKTLERAQLAVRQQLKSTKVSQDIHVYINEGEYFLGQPIVLSKADSGSQAARIIWEAEQNTKVIISGGKPLNCTKATDEIWRCPNSQANISGDDEAKERLGENSPNFQLYVDGHLMTLARWPNSEWAHIQTPLADGNNFTAMEKIPAINREDAKNGQVHIFAGNDWFDEYIDISNIETTNSTIEIAALPKYSLQPGRRFYLQNIRSLLDSSSEWFTDLKSGDLYFIPPPETTPNTIVRSNIRNIFILDNAQYITFKGLTLEHCSGTAIIAKTSSSIIMENLELRNIGGKGIIIKGGKNNSLSNSTVYNTGQQGVVLSGGDRTNLTPSDHLVHHNHIHNTGIHLLTYTPAIEINGVGAKVDQNLLEYGAGSSILITGNNHNISNNEIHGFCLQAADCGAVYSGRDWAGRGNFIKNNFIHDIPGYGLKELDIANNRVVYQSPDYAIGIYLDDGASGFNIDGNVLLNAGAVSLYIHGGKDNIFTNNYIITDRAGVWISKILTPNYDWSKNEERLTKVPYTSKTWIARYPELLNLTKNKYLPEGNKIEKNVIVSSKPSGPIFRFWTPKNSAIVNDNIIWSTTNNFSVDYNILDLNQVNRNATRIEWLTKNVETNSFILDPCISINNKQIMICDDSPIRKLHFNIPALKLFE